MATKILLLLPFLALTAYFFYKNPGIDRGEHGGIEYTVTKCLPILALSAVALISFRAPVTPLRTGLPFLDKIAGFRHPAALAFFLSAVGDWLLADRSNSLLDFTLGVVPFGLAHILNTKFYSSNLTSGQRYWWPAVLYMLVHSGLLGLWTLDNVFNRTDLLYQLVTTPYAFVLAWTVLCAISNWYYDPHRNENPTTLLYMLGYVTFMFSDSILMLDEFGWPIPRGQIYVLITYYAAQALIFLSFATHDVKAKGY